MIVWRCDGWRVTDGEATSDEWQSDEVMECLEMAEMAKHWWKVWEGWNEISMGFNGKGMEWNMVHDTLLLLLSSRLHKYQFYWGYICMERSTGDYSTYYPKSTSCCPLLLLLSSDHSKVGFGLRPGWPFYLLFKIDKLPSLWFPLLLLLSSRRSKVTLYCPSFLFNMLMACLTL